MDKYEFNIKVEQIKKMVSKGDFETSMKIADTIDWQRVRNANLLAMISQVYEKNGEYQEAKEVLLLAFERAPISKRLLYKLTELALKEGSVREAEDYYQEFCELAPEDSRQHLLRYMILKEKNASDEQLINALKRYTSMELDEKWMYELASLYAKAGCQEECVAMCDRIMLMFGFGKYVNKAMELKVQYAPLTDYQLELAENREKYEAKLKAVEQGDGEIAEEGFYEQENFGRENALDREAVSYGEAVFGEEIVPAAENFENETAEGGSLQAFSRMEALAAEESVMEVDQTANEELAAHIHQADVEKQLAEEMSRISVEEYQEKEPAAAQTRQLENVYSIAHVTTMAEPAMEAMDAPIVNHLMIESSMPESGLQMAIETLKKIHLESGSDNQVIKISGSRLSQRGIWNVANKLMGKDVIVEEAGDLSKEALDDLQQLVSEDTSGMVMVLIDNQRQLEALHHQNPELARLFECIGSEKNSAAEPEEDDIEAAVQKQIEAEEELAKEAEESPQAVAVVTDKEKTANIEPIHRAEDDEEMDPDDFADYACKYASDIDCSITGKSMLALYERIEIMEEDGIPLTRINAEDLIEEAADRAEKPSFGRLIKGVFSSKYDKEGLLILREDHFI